MLGLPFRPMPDTCTLPETMQVCLMLLPHEALLEIIAAYLETAAGRPTYNWASIHDTDPLSPAVGRLASVARKFRGILQAYRRCQMSHAWGPPARFSTSASVFFSCRRNVPCGRLAHSRVCRRCIAGDVICSNCHECSARMFVCDVCSIPQQGCWHILEMKGCHGCGRRVCSSPNCVAECSLDEIVGVAHSCVECVCAKRVNCRKCLILDQCSICRRSTCAIPDHLIPWPPGTDINNRWAMRSCDGCGHRVCCTCWVQGNSSICSNCELHAWEEQMRGEEQYQTFLSYT